MKNSDDLSPEYINEELEIAKAFSSSDAVNEALNSLLQLTKQTAKLSNLSTGTR